MIRTAIECTYDCRPSSLTVDREAAWMGLRCWRPRSRNGTGPANVVMLRVFYPERPSEGDVVTRARVTTINRRT